MDYRYQQIYRLPNVRAKSKTMDFAATDGNLTIFAAAIAGWSLHIQNLVITIKTSAAQAMLFEDDAGTPLYVAKLPASPGVDSRWEFDFLPLGRKLTTAKLFRVAMTAGNAGHIQAYGYSKKD